jgi:DNA-directed RNA polymerase subunit M/transcription elongation factor TFIIS
MERRVVSAGDSVESQCTKCKALLNHTVIAMVAGVVARVKCNTCGSEHNHRPAKEPKVAAVKAAKAEKAVKSPRAKTVKAPAISDEAIWEEMIRPLDPDLAVPYNMEGKFRANSLLTHPTFGIGMIASSQTGKIEVVFKAGRKLLRSAC